MVFPSSQTHLPSLEARASYLRRPELLRVQLVAKGQGHNTQHRSNAAQPISLSTIPAVPGQPKCVESSMFISKCCTTEASEWADIQGAPPVMHELLREGKGAVPGQPLQCEDCHLSPGVQPQAAPGKPQQQQVDISSCSCCLLHTACIMKPTALLQLAQHLTQHTARLQSTVLRDTNNMWLLLGD
jgi:hypothetical protein